MGKVTIIIESDKLTSLELEKIMNNEQFSDLVFEDPNINIFIVPSDED